MGKKLPKTELLAEIQLHRTRLLELVHSLPKRQLTRPGINSANWSIKDVLTHLLGWEQRVVAWCRSGIDGETPTLPGDGYKWNQLAQLNAKIQHKHHRKSVKQILFELEEVHQQTLAVIDMLDDQALTTLGYFAWTGKNWTVSDYLRSNTASHYKWASAKIRKWVKQLDAAQTK